jgi:hypothetical protein
VGPIKIAVISDGVDPSLLNDGCIANGRSFSSRANSADLTSSYYIPAGKHGTTMAGLICSICPEVSLYVCKLDTKQSVGSVQPEISADAAAQVSFSLAPLSRPANQNHGLIN